MDIITTEAFRQIDHVLCGQNNMHMVRDCWTNRINALQNHHFITIAEVSVSLLQKPKDNKSFTNVAALRNQSNRDEFYCAFVQHMTVKCSGQQNLEKRAEDILDAFQAGTKTLPKREVTAKRPWISEGTLELIQQRNTQRRHGDYKEECKLN